MRPEDGVARRRLRRGVEGVRRRVREVRRVERDVGRVDSGGPVHERDVERLAGEHGRGVRRDAQDEAPRAGHVAAEGAGGVARVGLDRGLSPAALGNDEVNVLERLAAVGEDALADLEDRVLALEDERGLAVLGAGAEVDEGVVVRVVGEGLRDAGVVNDPGRAGTAELDASIELDRRILEKECAVRLVLGAPGFGAAAERDGGAADDAEPNACRL